MPVYEFTCKKCNTDFSKKSSIAEKKNIECPKCDSKELKENFTTSVKKKSVGANDACSLFAKRLSGG